jgi:hypothetical protein
VIAWSFVNKVLTIAQMPCLQRVVAIMMIGIFLALVVISIVSMTQGDSFNCNKNFLGEEWDFIMVFSVV